MPFLSILIQLAALQTGAPAYRGFFTGMPYRAFAEQARSLAIQDVLRCNTSANTAQLMECGVAIRDPSDNARFYLSAYVIEGRVVMLSFGDSGDVRLVNHMQQELKHRFGPAHALGHNSWEWRASSEQRVVRLSWRGRGTTRWIYVNLADYQLMNAITHYARPAAAQ